jgi:hypothetical protein
MKIIQNSETTEERVVTDLDFQVLLDKNLIFYSGNKWMFDDCQKIQMFFHNNDILINKPGKINLSKKIEAVCQNYLGMTPADKDCKDWNEMQKKMTKEIMDLL